ncbi:Uncharacterized protein FWK35_00034735 [Aphis craccivora]|uniref:Uncharacterized protein n=1 Tax=Aphis craccivora TaxID=307492 RepID=A0A6G0VHN0_APHCR|nr:Uncharacterized protein FWK35_00034735 [Aphis craccivora]
MDNTTIIFWNCLDVSRKSLELLQLAQLGKIDIFLLNETHLTKKTTKPPLSYPTITHTQLTDQRKAIGLQVEAPQYWYTEDLSIIKSTFQLLE